MITGTILARNEEAVIGEALVSLRPHVDELFLIDMESEDDTCDVARPLVDKIISHPLIQRFDSARNVAFEHASNDWLLFTK